MTFIIATDDVLNPGGIDSTGRVIFYEDVYRKFNWKFNAMETMSLIQLLA